MDKPEVFNMSILSDTAHENMINSEAAVTYILKALFSDVFKFDGTTEVMISENIKRGCPHIWKDPNYRIISDKLFHWWLSDMPYIYLAMLEDQKFVPVLYENLKKIVKYTVSLYGFFFCETTGIGQYKEKLVFLCKAFSHALYTPVRINGHIVYCLHACGVIVKNYDL